MENATWLLTRAQKVIDRFDILVGRSMFEDPRLEAVVLLLETSYWEVVDGCGSVNIAGKGCGRLAVRLV